MEEYCSHFRKTIIMMSQNLQQELDRFRATHDYQVNLKAELEIRHLHQKVDHLMAHQWEMLVGIQEVQMEFLDAIHAEKRKEKELEDNPWSRLAAKRRPFSRQLTSDIGRLFGTP